MNLDSFSRIRIGKFLLGSASALALLSMLPAPAQAAPSSFQNSCRNIELFVDPSFVRIHAECRTRSGSYKQATYGLGGISNEFGVLSLKRRPPGTPAPPSSFQNSCNDIELHMNAGEVKIAAVCEDGRGGSKRTSIILHNIENNDGRMMWRNN